MEGPWCRLDWGEWYRKPGGWASTEASVLLSRVSQHRETQSVTKGVWLFIIHNRNRGITLLLHKVMMVKMMEGYASPVSRFDTQVR